MLRKAKGGITSNVTPVKGGLNRNIKMIIPTNVNRSPISVTSPLEKLSLSASISDVNRVVTRPKGVLSK